MVSSMPSRQNKKCGRMKIDSQINQQRFSDEKEMQSLESVSKLILYGGIHSAVQISLLRFCRVCGH